MPPKHASENEISNQEQTPLGIRYVVEGQILLGDGVIAALRSVWFIELGERVPRLLTAYPLKAKKQI